MTKSNFPLVSIIVITYNSSEYVLETLESAKAQTYPNIELIITDDASEDNSVDICKVWLRENADRFTRIKLVTVEKNSGIPANCNRGVKVAKGEWVKIIAGDDILAENCIETFVNFVSKNSSISVVESISQYFGVDNQEKILLHQQNFGHHLFFHENATSQHQYEILLRRNLIHAPSVFIKKKALEDVGLFDEEFRWMEDHPLWLKLTKAGYKFHFLNKVTVFYRIHTSSVFSSLSQEKLFSAFYRKRKSADKKYIYPYVGKLELALIHLEYYRKKMIEGLGLNSKSLVGRIVHRLTQYLSPINKYRKYELKKIEQSIKQA